MANEKFRSLVTKRCGTARRFASKVGLTESMVSRMICGNRKVYPWHIDNFSKVLGISADEVKEILGSSLVAS